MPRIDVLESFISYTDSDPERDGTPVVLLHGNPTSSHIWRHVIPLLSDSARVLAPDLIGMGSSGKPSIAYRFADHADYLAAWLDRLGVDEAVLVGYDWGGPLALDWATRHPGRTRGVALMETFLRPMTWAEYPAGAVEFFRALRTPGTGETMALTENWFIEQALRATNPTISDADLEHYRRPYPTEESRRPLLQFPREIPLDGEPADVRVRFEAFDHWLAASPEVPKLLLTAGRAGLVSKEIEEWARETIAALDVVDVGAGGHHIPEDRPEEIGTAVAAWIRENRLTRA